MKCVWTQKVSLLIDGELAAVEARDVERHLDACGDCQQAREDFLLLRRQLADYPLELDAFARQRALKRVLAAGDVGAAKFASERATSASPRRGARLAGVFGMPRLSPVGLAALLLLLVGVAAVVVSLMSSRRAPAEVVKYAPMPAPAGNNNNAATAATAADNSNNAATAATPIASPTVGNDLTASTNKQGGEVAVVNSQKKRAGGAVPKPSPKSERFNASRIDMPVVESARNDVEATTNGGVIEPGRASELRDAGDDAAARRGAEEAADNAAGESKTARHVEQAQLLLRSFRNARPADAGRRASSDLAYEKQRSKKLLYENIVLRREAASRGNLPVESLLNSLEPILIDIANLPDKPAPADVKEINERMRRKNLVAMLQISAVESASARSY
ncbi:MAG: hypothetical protein QOE47_1083 [Pyrinomonadaceae bacterium]|nr:hypothetical protein [Pyrinomonadaceae bacterium]